MVRRPALMGAKQELVKELEKKEVMDKSDKDDYGDGGGVHTSVGFQSWHLITVIRSAARASTIMLASCCIFDEKKPKNVSKVNIATNFAKHL